MTPTEFEFRVTMPGDERLVGAIRQLTAHAAGYARLNAAQGEELASEVERATTDAISAAAAPAALIELHFSGSTEAIVVTVHWTTQGSRQTRHIRQRLSA